MSVKVLGCGLSVTKFPAGESLVKFTQLSDAVSNKFVVRLDFESNSDLIDLALTVDAIRREAGYGVDIHLLMPYLPYARQDRVCNDGESLSVKVIADFINSLDFNLVICYDLHSDVSGALINRLQMISLAECVTQIGLDKIIKDEVYILVAPDAGAYKKVSKLNNTLNNGYMVTASKIRDTKTGKLSGTVVDIPDINDLQGRKFLIVDDILDNGGTFIPLATAIKEKCSDAVVSLYVTHGLFNSGIDKFYGIFDKIYVANNMMKKDFNDTHGIMVTG